MSPALAAIIDTTKLVKVVVVSLVAAIGVTTVFSLGVASGAGMLDALRRRRSALGGALAALTLLCLGACGAAIAIGIVVMSGGSP